MSSDLPAGTYSITNRQAPLDLYLSDDRVSIIGGKVGPEDFRTWIFEPVDDGFLIKSKVDELYIGFRDDSPMIGTKLIVGDRDMAKVWFITEEQVGDGPRFVIMLTGVPLVMEFPRDNLRPGTPAQLGIRPRVFPSLPNQSWIITPQGD